MSDNVHRKAGPSGKPMLHFIMCSSRAEACESARQAGQGRNEFKQQISQF